MKNDKLKVKIPETGLQTVERNPAVIYLSRLGSPVSRTGMKDSLQLLASRLSRGERDFLNFQWHLMRYPHVIALRSLLADMYAPATANKHLAALRGVLKECWRLGLMSGDDYSRAVDFERVKGERLPSGRALQHAELHRLFSAAAKDKVSGSRDAAILGLLYATGLRRSEIVKLNVGDFSKLDGSLKVRGKGNKERVLYVSNGALDALLDWLEIRGEASPDAPLFIPYAKSNLKERRMNAQTIYALLLNLAARAGIEHFTPHDLRRTFVSTLLDKGADLAVVQKLAGHAKPETTSRYDFRGESAKVSALAKLVIPYQGASRHAG